MPSVHEINQQQQALNNVRIFARELEDRLEHYNEIQIGRFVYMRSPLMLTDDSVWMLVKHDLLPAAKAKVAELEKWFDKHDIEPNDTRFDPLPDLPEDLDD